MDWPAEIKKLTVQRKWSMRQLALDIGVSQQFLNEVARGVKPASPMLKLKIMGLLGYDLSRDNLIDIFPDDVANAIRDMDIKRSLIM